jgi:NAD+ synthase (glutamine-hydrolysing)
MVLSYMYAQLIPEQNNIPSYLLVLAAGNVDEALIGYLTKYDCSSGDLNLIGSIHKVDIQKMLLYLVKLYPDLTALKDIAQATPTAELTPAETQQSDETDIGLTFVEIKQLNLLRKKKVSGIVSTYEGMCKFFPDLSP